LEDLSLRADFHRALDAIAPPAPWLAAVVRDGMRERRKRERKVRSGIQNLPRPTWLLPAVAALLAIAIVIALVASGQLPHMFRPVPVRPPQHGLAAPAGCPAWSDNPSGGGAGPASDKMTSPSVGWANGALRTTDGGAHWQHLAPNDMLSDAPKGTDPKAYPPGYVDYFLDPDHAWLAYSYPSTTSCFDHVTVFSTADGGQSWKRSRPVDAAVQADSSLQLQMYFIDAQHGWLLVLGQGRIVPDWLVYTTTNGGLDWKLLSQIQLMSSFCSVEFISLAVGFLGDCQNTSGPIPQLTVTRDGGKTWGSVPLPTPVGTQFTVTDPVFFNQDQGIIHVTAQTFAGNTQSPSDYLAITSDGGKTWSALPQLSIPGYAQAFAFIDINHFFALVSDGKGSTESIYRTADGGRAWSAAGDLPPMVQSYPEVMFIDSQHGFVDEPGQKIGDGPLAFISTSDGGRTWKDLHPQVS
jgi:photosystem II stability/assembly factor-like uncharacterized protein